MTYLKKLNAHYLDLAKSPIRDGDFIGSDARYSAEYERLEKELNKPSSPHETGIVDWQRVREGCESLLASQSKDLRVAAWLIWGLYKRESFAGLHAGLGLLNYLCANHWTELYPRKPRTRAAAVSWLVPRLEQVFAEPIPLVEQLMLFRELAEQLRSLERLLSEQLGSDAPLLLPLCRRMEEQVRQASVGQPEPGSVGAVIAQVKQAASQMLTPGAPVESEKDAHKGLRALQEQARPLCAYWLKQKANDLRALRLARTLLWLPIEGLPERNAEQMTSLRGLPQDRLVSFQERFQQGQYADLLSDLEASLVRAPFWLDGQHLVWLCLQELQAEQAMREVEIQLALFLQRMKGLEMLRFHDGSPFADAQTRAWISAQVMPHVQPPSSTAPPVASEQELRLAWDVALQDNLPRLRKEGLKPAVQALKQGLASAQGGRERFFWHLALARLCVAAKKYELAKTQLESLDQTLQAGGLSDWEPDLVLEVMRLLYSCCELLPQNHAVRERKEEVHRRLCHLDIEVVLD